MSEKNIELRGDVYYWRAVIGGRRFYESLQTGNLAEARSRARIKRAAAEGQRWEDLRATRTRAGYSTLTQVCDAYEAHATLRRLKAATVRGNRRALVYLLRRAGVGGELGSISAAVLTAQTIRAAARAMIDGQTGLQEVRARRSLHSFARQARSLFTGGARQAYADAGLVLPDLAGFLGADLGPCPAVQYERRPAHLVAGTLEAARGLRDSAPDLYCVFLLLYYGGLRAGEAVAARKTWIEAGPAGHVLSIRPRPDEGWEPKRCKARRVAVHADVMRELLAVWAPDSVWILPGATPTARRNLVERRFAQWMRAQGWDAARYPKAGHELRKLAGSRIYSTQGAEAAAEVLGHSSVATTCRYYAALDREAAPLPLAW